MSAAGRSAVALVGVAVAATVITGCRGSAPAPDLLGDCAGPLRPDGEVRQDSVASPPPDERLLAADATWFEATRLTTPTGELRVALEARRQLTTGTPQGPVRPRVAPSVDERIAFARGTGFLVQVRAGAATLVASIGPGGTATFIGACERRLTAFVADYAAASGSTPEAVLRDVARDSGRTAGEGIRAFRGQR